MLDFERHMYNEKRRSPPGNRLFCKEDLFSKKPFLLSRRLGSCAFLYYFSFEEKR